MALAKNRNTPARDGNTLSIGVAAGVHIFAGALVALTAAGTATPGAVATTLKGAGRAIGEVDNSDGGAGDAARPGLPELRIGHDRSRTGAGGEPGL